MLREDGRWTFRYDKALRDPARFRCRPTRRRTGRCSDSIATPTLLVRGAESDLLDPAIAPSAWRAVMPDCTLVTVPDAGHLDAARQPAGLHRRGASPG